MNFALTFGAHFIYKSKKRKKYTHDICVLFCINANAQK